jgi:uncharacterized repeat protein (TIGR01451 family)
METKRSSWVIGVMVCGHFISKIKTSFFKEVIMAKQHFFCLGILFFFLLLMGSAMPATSQQIETAIENGVAWLAAQQNSSEGYWEDGTNRAGPTGLALVKLQERAFELGYTPFDTSYAYHENVEDGFVYLFGRLASINITNQLYGNPDTDSDGIGIYLPGNDTYDTGIAMMAIASSRSPNRVVNAPGSAVHGWTYKQVLTDMVDYMAYGQCESGNGRGGWGYSANDCSAVDNSNSGYAVSSLGYAQAPRYSFECTVPPFVKNELLIWADYVQTDSTDDENGGSGYTGPGAGSTLRTGNLVYQMTFGGRDSDHTNVQRAVSYIGRQWNDANQNPGWGNPAYYSGDPHYQAMYCAANGLSYARVNEISVGGQPRDWYADFADALVDTQETNGSWTGDPHGGAILSTEWALLALERPAFLLDLIKTDNVEDPNCVSPGQSFTYSICWTNDSGQTIEDAYIIDRIPDGVDYDYFDFDTMTTDPNYSIEDHTYTWFLGDINPNDNGCVQLTVTVNNKAEPGLDLYNVAEMYDIHDRMVGRGDRYTPVCCWDNTEPDIIYVDQTANGYNNGTSWTDAYMDLQDALYRAEMSECEEAYIIYVAQGLYKPGNYATSTFKLPDNVSVYGGFLTGGCDFSQRNPKQYETVLTGDFDNDGFPDVDTIVTMGDETILDGFTVTRTTLPSGRCVYGNGVDFEVANCTVTESGGYGIQAENGNVTVRWCKVLLNTTDGIYHRGQGYTLTVENSWLLRNGECGILSEISTPTVKNSIVSESDFIDDEFANAGIRIVNPTGQPKLHNLTISNNRAEGIYFEHTDPNYFKEENSANRIEMQNCIVYFNNGDGPQFSQQLQVNLDRVAHYSCIADCNSVNNNTSDAPLFAYTIDPNGVPDPNNYHLHFDDAACKDKGDPYDVYTGQVDMDGEGVDRIEGTQIDIGADEVRACATSSNDDIYNALDWDADGLVNLKEFSSFQRAWLSYDPNHPLCDPNHPDFVSDPNAPGYISEQDKQRFNENCDLVSDLTIDLLDIEKFVSDTPWLWKACWKDSGLYESTAMSGGGESMMMAMPEIFTAETAAIPSEAAIVSEKSIKEQILDIEDCIGFLEQLWLEEPDIQQEITPADWKAFMDAVYQGLLELQDLKAESVQIE